MIYLCAKAAITSEASSILCVQIVEVERYSAKITSRMWLAIPVGNIQSGIIGFGHRAFVT
jgi:hypothetical protein